jgi:hypothetical protein
MWKRAVHCLRYPGRLTKYACDGRHRQLGESLETIRLKTNEEWTKMLEEWGEKGSSKRSDAEHAFHRQLKHDPLWAQAQPPRKPCFYWFWQFQMHLGKKAELLPPRNDYHRHG